MLESTTKLSMILLKEVYMNITFLVIKLSLVSQMICIMHSNPLTCLDMNSNAKTSKKFWQRNASLVLETTPATRLSS